MLTFQVDALWSSTIAIMLLLMGKFLAQRYEVFRRYSIPEPLLGGALCAVVVAVAYYAFDLRVEFSLDSRDTLLLYFFAAIGLRAEVRTLLKGGRLLIVLGLLATGFIVLQNLTGMAVADAFGMDPKTGLLVGSVSLTGGIGTTMAWSPIFVEQYNVLNASELGIAANTVGLFAACIIGGPTAAWLMRRHRIAPSGDFRLAVGTMDERSTRFNYFYVLRALFLLNCTLILGLALDELLKNAPLTIPTFVSCLMAGIVIRNLPLVTGRDVIEAWPGTLKGLALISDITLGLFLTMALMGMQLWSLEGVFTFVIAVLVVQILLAIAFAAFVVFRGMGGDYEAAVVSAGFSGISLGSTATAVVNMSAVTQRFGAAHHAFIVVPLVCGFLVDLANALIIGVMLTW
ncbi:MAG: sodium/glutamate symporter [Thiohalomonadaceae bacterium]